MEEDKCILCSSPLCIYGEDLDVSIGITTTMYKYFCPNKKCKRYALLTVSNVDLESLTND